MKRGIEDKLKDLCVAHSQLTETIETHRDSDGSSKVLQEMWDDQLKELETRIISLLKENFLNTTRGQKSSAADSSQASLIDA